MTFWSVFMSSAVKRFSLAKSPQICPPYRAGIPNSSSRIPGISKYLHIPDNPSSLGVCDKICYHSLSYWRKNETPPQHFWYSFLLCHSNTVRKEHFPWNWLEIGKPKDLVKARSHAILGWMKVVYMIQRGLNWHPHCNHSSTRPQHFWTSRHYNLYRFSRIKGLAAFW